MTDKIKVAAEPTRDRLALIPVIASAIFVITILIVYNIFKYQTLEETDKTDIDVSFSSASVVVSKPLYGNTNTLIRYKRVCVLSANTSISDEQAIKAALGNAKAYTGYSNYRVDVIRPCKSHQIV